MDKPIFRGFYIMYLTNNMGIKKQIKNRLQQFYTSLIAHYEYHLYKKQSKNYLSINGYPNIKLEGEDEYVKKWDSLSKKIEVYSYRFYSNYMGLNPNIVPEDILHSYIETKLNPRKYLQSYTDKNIFQQIIENKYLPVTLLCRMNGSNILDSDYQVFDFTEDITVKFRNVSSVILKPSVDTSSGKGVIKFTRKNKHFVNKDGIVLNK